MDIDEPKFPEEEWLGLLKGKLTIPTGTGTGEEYAGSYDITPKAFEDQVLPTAGKTLEDDLTIFAIPYFETSNESNGMTVYIGNGG